MQGMAAGWCLLMVAFLAVVQSSGGPAPPLFLFLLFSGVWLFGAVMLMVAPRMGAWGTAAYGVILAVQVLNMHGGTALNYAIAVASLVGSGLAVAVLVVLRRPRGEPA